MSSVTLSDASFFVILAATLTVLSVFCYASLYAIGVVIARDKYQNYYNRVYNTGHDFETVTMVHSVKIIKR